MPRLTPLKLARCYGLQRNLAVVLSELLALKTVYPERIEEAGVGTLPKVAVHRLRVALGRKIRIHSGRHLGYWIDAADKKKVRAYVATKEAA